VLSAALPSPRGEPAALYGELAGGRFDLTASPRLLAELERVLSREKFRRYTSSTGRIATSARSRGSRSLPRTYRRCLASPPIPQTPTS